MQTSKTTLVTETIFSEDGTKRYLLKKTWDKTKPKLAIIMLAPSDASDIVLDNSTQLVLNNAFRLGFGSIEILNLFSDLNDFSLKKAEDKDVENVKMICKSAQDADTIVYAPGVGKSKNKAFQKRQEMVLMEMKKFKEKLFCLCDKDGKARFQHPLSPAVRTWYLSAFEVKELIDDK